MSDHNNLVQYKFAINDKQSFLDQAKNVGGVNSYYKDQPVINKDINK